MQEKNPGKTKKQEIFITFLQMWTIFPQNPGKLTEKRKAAGLRKSGGLLLLERERRKGKERGFCSFLLGGWL